ncbi:MAG: pilus assembly protein PilM [Candidatus Omnitrophota bacterium]|nr:pilus assembly protein PilM [Candidatus Omnitrophota bacterium]MBU1928722.1 pilus assembly protein PilM [Candidatus Omnitrophota bacterium]MBU2034177.1 pilus assembly protein PilM [Candidatus Omnitrophota bacterium]
MFISGIRRRDLVGIEFGANKLKLAYLRCLGGKRELAGVVSKDTLGCSDTDISGVILAFLNQHNIKNPEFISVISSSSVITKNIEVPSVDPQEIKGIINLQAARHTPYSREEIIVDYIDIGNYKNNYTKILLVIVVSSLIKKYVEILGGAGLGIEKVLLASEGMAWAAMHILKVENKDIPVCLLHIDENSSDFAIVFKNKLAFIRSIPIGAKALSGEFDIQKDKYCEEVKKSMESYQGEDIEKNPGSILITGAIDGLKGLETALSLALNKDSRVVPYLRNISISKDLLKSIDVSAASYFNLVSPLLACDDMLVDLIPEEAKIKKELEARGRDLIKSGILVLTFFILVFFILMSKIYFKSFYLNKIDSRYKGINQEASKLEKDFDRINLIKNYLGKRGYPLEILTEIYGLLPLQIELSDLRFDEQGKFVVRGSAESMSTVFSFVDEMERSKYFKDVKTKYTTRRKQDKKDVTDFEINCLLEKEG